MPTLKITEAFSIIDASNANDPNKEIVQGISIAKELVYGQRMSQTLDNFTPEASEALQLAARAQHICRWEIPRNSYPMDRVGYLKWREELKKFHAKKASEILEKVGYNQEVIDRVSFLIQKKKLKKDEDTQILEDVICLVFLEFYYTDFYKKHASEKVIDILQKTWRKMSEKGHQAALKISYSEKGLDLIKQAIA
ncbi:DUF4202 domain-containing protein [Aquimarina sp. MMG015]|uniref:DUF4202 domain-containing protein n=1 Tax=unclassified Aquimarina TaxID=2627091 RepID=UPI000E5135B4|nr:MULTISPECIES: DUF4202 domain-containing protein [unclassified Aquimarina]AXT55923.1 DUF4202 domain-containing protein [Aquimarina sp. AD1]MBQ4803997.1 DUF4202 domain-containing protein [Aquimarina sp. MMG015]RKN21684.1 DUF4202 family protein [Aquimarina sp. AD1]